MSESVSVVCEQTMAVTVEKVDSHHTDKPKTEDKVQCKERAHTATPDEYKHCDDAQRYITIPQGPSSPHDDEIAENILQPVRSKEEAN